jgi:anti-anti-sigma regulatory factor
MTADPQTYVLDALSIQVSKSGDSTTIAWHGVSDSRSPGISLQPVTQRLSASLKGREVVVDFRSLEFINSATIAPLIQFVRDLSTKGCAVLVLFDPDKDWQKAHYLCMRTIARTLARVQVESQKRA